MDSILFKAAISGDIEVLGENMEELGNQTVRCTENTVLHLVARSGKKECVEGVLSMHPSLLLKVNTRGETALHLAANGGHASVVQALIDHARALNEPPQVVDGSEPPQVVDDSDIESGGEGVKMGKEEVLMRMINKNGDTALHEAVQYNQVDVVIILTQEDPNFKHPRNKVGETPLYLAAHRGYHDLVSLILQTCRSPTYGGPNGGTALHGAIISNSKECADKLLEWGKFLLMVHDSDGWTALHLAAHIGHTDMVCQLLSADENVGYLSISNPFSIQNTALHIAAGQGHIPIMKEITSRCPDSWDSVNNRGRNVLHIAAEHKQKEVTEYILEDFPFISSLINQRDKVGNTPLHLLASSNLFVPKLIQHSMVDKNAVNKGGRTPLNMAVIESDVAEGLKRVGAVSNYEKNKYTFYPDLAAKRMKKMDQTHMIVAALVATVAFTAGFTVPGGFNGNEGPNQGFAILAKATAFKAFIISDTLALLCSTTALLLYFRSPITDHDSDDLLKSFVYAAYLIIAAIVTMMFAFVTGTYVVLAHLPALATVTSLCGCSFFLICYLLLRNFFTWSF